MLRLRGENFHLVAALQMVAQRHEFMVDLGPDAMGAKEGMDLESKVEGCASGGHGHDFALGGEDEDFAGKKVELDGVEEVHGVGLRVVEDFLDGAQPVVEFAVAGVHFLRAVVAFLVFPVGGKSLLGYFVHAVGAYLHLYPAARVRHERDVQGLIAVALRVVEPVAQAVGV